MSVAYEFLHGKENLEFASSEDMINFVIDHYFELMSVYRVMKAQNEATREKKINAHMDLQDLRERKELMDPKYMTEVDKMELEAKEKYFSKLREEDDIHHYKGEPVEISHLSMLILQHPRLMATLEQLDGVARFGLSNVTRKVVSGALYPVRRLTKSAIKQSKPKGRTRGFLKGLQSVINAIPEIVEESILASMNVNLEDHQPPQNSHDEDEQYVYINE